MESGSDEHYVRCRRCHGTFESTLSSCPRCGTAYVAPVEASAPDGSYAERYQGTRIDESATATRGRRSNTGLMLAFGGALIVVAMAVASLVAMGAFDEPKPTPTPVAHIVSIITPSPVPTKPPAIANTIAQLTSPDLNFHVSIKTSLSLNARVNAHGGSRIVSLDVDCAGGNQSGVSKSGSIGTEWRLVDNTYYQRSLPSGKWALKTGITPAVILSPMFQLHLDKELQYDGQDNKNGIQADKLETTDWWVPDTAKVAGTDVSGLGISPAHTKLYIWVDSGGTPLYASFRAWTDASDGTNLLDITSTYTFSQVGIVNEISAPK